MNVRVDRDRCIGSGQCALNAPAVFDQSEDDGLVVLLDDTPAADRDAEVRHAADVCPARAIAVTEAGTGRG